MKLLNTFFNKTPLLLVWVIWYVVAFLMTLGLDLLLADVKTGLIMFKIGAGMSLWFACFGTLVVYNTRRSDAAWNDLKELALEIDATEDKNILTILREELSVLAQRSTGATYNSEVRRLKTVLDLKNKYLPNQL